MIDNEKLNEKMNEFKCGMDNLFYDTIQNRLLMNALADQVKNLEQEIIELKKNKEKNER